MLNFLIISNKSGLPIRTLGTIPKGYHDSYISTMATLVNMHSKQFNEDKELVDKDFTIFFKKDETPYAKTKDKSIIKLIEGKYVNIVYSASIDANLIPVDDILKSSDKPTSDYLLIKKIDLTDMIEDSIFTKINN